MKTLARILATLAVAVLPASLFGDEKKPAIDIRQLTPQDDSILEEWVRVTNEKELLGVDAARLKQSKWNWQIAISVAEFVREDPLESRLRTAITAALKNARGVKSVVREDREVWLVQGETDGEELVRACSVALEQLAPDLRAALKAK